MKNLFFCGALAMVLCGTMGCADREDRDRDRHMSTTTTTEETHVRHPVEQTTTVETTR